jgi:deazaflavin-dependent oxidoreductase (nitroreductase family)
VLRRAVWNAFVRAHTAAYRLTGGRIGSSIRGLSTLLLDHLGRKSGKRRTCPLLYVEDGDDLVIIASKGGSHAHPAWWLNLRASPQTSVQVGVSGGRSWPGRRVPRRRRRCGPAWWRHGPTTRTTSGERGGRSR